VTILTSSSTLKSQSPLLADFLLGLLFDPEDGGSKRSSSRLHGITSQKIEEGGDHGLFQGIIPTFPRGTEETHEFAQGVPAEIQTGHLKN
jgi:hypothetical protein